MNLKITEEEKRHFAVLCGSTARVNHWNFEVVLTLQNNKKDLENFYMSLENVNLRYINFMSLKSDSMINIIREIKRLGIVLPNDNSIIRLRGYIISYLSNRIKRETI